MKKITIILSFIFCLMSFGFAQDEMETYDIWNQLGHTVSSADSVFWSGGFYIHGDDSINIYIPVKSSEGVLAIWGYVYDDTCAASHSGADTVYFSISTHHGNGIVANPLFTHTYIPMDTAYIDTMSTAQFEIYPMSNSTLRDKGCNKYDLKIVGVANYTRAFYIKIEWIE